MNSLPTSRYEYTTKDWQFIQETGRQSIAHYYDKLKLASEHGYGSYVEFVAIIYKEQKSLRKTGKIVGIECHKSISQILKWMNVPIQSKGGFNRPKAKIFYGKPCVRCGSTERYESTKACRKCNNERTKEWFERKKRVV